MVMAGLMVFHAVRFVLFSRPFILLCGLFSLLLKKKKKSALILPHSDP